MDNKDYRASIKVVGTVIPDTKLILKKYLEIKDIELLRIEVLDNNLILKTSKRRAETIFYEVRKRYLYDQLDGYKETSFIYFIKNIMSDSIVNLLLYYYLCKEERIIYEYVTDIVYKKYKDGFLGISLTDTTDFILELAKNVENISKWSERTVNDVRSGLMGVIKEFGLINSRKRPIFNKIFFPSIIFYYVLYNNRDKLKTINDIYECKDLSLFLLIENDINVLIEEAYRNGVLDFGDDEDKFLIYKYKDLKEIVDGFVNGEIR